jgi:hypothetical protein
MNELLDHRGVNSVAEAFFSSLQRELLDQQHWGDADPDTR